MFMGFHFTNLFFIKTMLKNVQITEAAARIKISAKSEEWIAPRARALSVETRQVNGRHQATP